MLFREATVNDIQQIQYVRHAVKENMLSNPALVTNNDVLDYITRRGKGWVCDVDEMVVGFAIADLLDHNIWALFIHPSYEGKGIGTRLHRMMLNWYFSISNETVWLSTAPGTRAEGFYKKAGWKETGAYGKGEVRFEMNRKDWLNYQKAL